jgi:SAM-dependent methyltransferase
MRIAVAHCRRWTSCAIVSPEARMALTYDPRVFQVNDLAAAMKIILTEEDSSSDTRWKTETPYAADLIGQYLTIDHDSLLLDYGCGIGRVAKELIARYGCRVIGTDISAQMRALAPIYVDSERFFACSPAMLDYLIEQGVAFDGAVAIWVLQHCYQPADDIARIRRTLKPSSRLFVLNNLQRVVPTREKGWYDDRLDVRALLRSEFSLLQEGKPALERTSPLIAQHTYWAVFAPNRR